MAETEKSTRGGAQVGAQSADFAQELLEGIPAALPEPPPMDPAISRAPARALILDAQERRQAVHNALRYFPAEWHAQLAPEFAAELARYGRIYMYRFRPKAPIFARPITAYPARSLQAAAVMQMIQNNLDPAVAQHPYELVTYGGNGAVFQNWAQYRLCMALLAQMSEEQTLVMHSGHPVGLFPSHPHAPRVVVTNGLMVPNYSRPEDYQRLSALGVTSYGQMTAGSYMYIGPQGIVHGTTLTLLNAGRHWLGTGAEGLRGKVFVSSGLGGMSGAQAKAARIAGAVGVVAEINPEAARKRHSQGWVDELYEELPALVARIRAASAAGEAVSLAYVGNVVDLWVHLADHQVEVHLGSDQTSLHLPYSGGYYPQGLSYAQANAMMVADPEGFRESVRASLRAQVAAIDRLSARGMRFWDYGNAFLLEASRAGAPVEAEAGSAHAFRYPSYVEDLMGPLCFDFGFGPFRWICMSNDPADLALTDALAAQVLRELLEEAEGSVAQQYADNLRWIEQAGANQMVVGAQARILYADDWGRRAIARAFNTAVADGRLKGPVVLGRDHHDVSGTDSPWRETANIRDGSRFCADMATHNVIGDAFRGATWVSLHNGGGVGWGESINGGFGLLLDGSRMAALRLESMLFWDVNHGVARRAWAHNPNARWAIERAMAAEPKLKVVRAHAADEATVAAAVDAAFTGGEV